MSCSDIPTSAAGWHELNRARSALVVRYDHVKIGVRDDPIQTLIEIGEVARQLRTHGISINLMES